MASDDMDTEEDAILHAPPISSKRVVLIDAGELEAMRKEHEILIHAIDDWRDRLAAITPQDLAAAWHVVNNAVAGEAEDQALFLLSDGIAELGRLRAWRDRAVSLLAHGGNQGEWVEVRALLAESEATDAHS